MSGTIKAADLTVKQAQAEASAAAGLATAAAVKDEQVAQGFLRRNVWAVLGIAVVLAVIAAAAVLR
ncbi:MAG: hypothetical protein KGN77_01905 [Xanthomonadaceae bacterium]|nr:hypothetical protein [Xanthomonadaceae bacterium]